jgi:uncharacterized Rmd1/YagE family protein
MSMQLLLLFGEKRKNDVENMIIFCYVVLWNFEQKDHTEIARQMHFDAYPNHDILQFSKLLKVKSSGDSR